MHTHSGNDVFFCFAEFSRTAIFRGFSVRVISIARRQLLEIGGDGGGGGGVQRPVLRIKGPSVAQPKPNSIHVFIISFMPFVVNNFA